MEEKTPGEKLRGHPVFAALSPEACETIARNVEPLVRNYSADELLRLAKQVGDGYSFVKIELRKGDSAYAPGTTKYVLRGVGTVEYMIHASGWDAVFFGDVYRSRIEP